MVDARANRGLGWLGIMQPKRAVSARHFAYRAFVYAVLIAVVLSGCQEDEVTRVSADALHEAIKDVNGLTVFFGHQSVGGNMLDGLQGLDGWEAPIVEIHGGEDISGVESGSVLHAYVGKNEFPDTKIKDFAEILRSGIAEKTDVVFLKFCYVDINRIHDVEQIFRMYVEGIETLIQEYPKTKFVHLTMPLMSQRRGIKDRIKQVLGMETPGREGNMLRNQYNNLLRQEFGGTGHVFDIAAAEATRPDGSRETFLLNGEEYEAMAPEYTSDGGHLNDLGQQIVAEKLVLYLSGLGVDP